MARARFPKPKPPKPGSLFDQIASGEVEVFSEDPVVAAELPESEPVLETAASAADQRPAEQVELTEQTAQLTEQIVDQAEQIAEHIHRKALSPTEQRERKMLQTALVFLDEPEARRLAVAWVSCGGDEKLWLEAAGISTMATPAHHRTCRVLQINSICRPGGVTDELALRYIAALVGEPLREQQQRAEKRSRQHDKGSK